MGRDAGSRAEIWGGRLAARCLRPFLGVEPLPLEVLRRSAPRRILLVRPNPRLGNTLLASPAIEIFRRAFPEAAIDYLAAGAAAEILRGLPLNELLVLPRDAWLRPGALVDCLLRIRGRRYDLAVDCGFGSRIDSVIAALSGARLRAGVENEANGFLYHLRAPLPPRDLHKEEKWEHFAQGLGIGYRGERMRVLLADEEREWARGWRRERGIDGRVRAGLFVGGRDRKGKRWPLDSFLALARRLAGRDGPVLVFVGPEEAGMGPAIAAGLPAGSHIVQEPSIRRVAALIAGLPLFISGDSGPMHLACALEVPVLAIFLKDNWRRWGPRPDRGRVLLAREGLDPEEVALVAEEMLRGRGKSEVGSRKSEVGMEDVPGSGRERQEPGAC